MTDAQREQAYSPSSCLPDADHLPFVDDYRRLSDLAWGRLGASDEARVTTVRYGDATSQTIDVAVPTTADAPPLLVFFHGGYWQELSKADSRFAAAHCIDRGWAFAAVDYTLAPHADLAEIVAECRRAASELSDAAGSLGFDPARVFVAGSSAGAHLAAMVCSDPHDPVHPIRGAVLVSGIFELEPLIGTSINHAIQLDEAAAARNSPLHADLADFPATLVAYGADETDEFKAQSDTFAVRLRAGGTPVTVLEVPERNHFDVVVDLARPGTALGDAAAHLIETHGGDHAEL